jgi:hypothetical protein
MSLLAPLVRKDAPPDVRKYIKRHGDDEIVNILVCRKPIQKGVDKFINIITAGKYDRNKTKMKYEDMYHLYLVLENDHNQTYKWEKNHVVTVTKATSLCKNYIGVPMTRSLKVYEMFDKALKSQGNNMWLYDAVTNNCQVFVMNMLASNGLMTEKLADFIKQDAEKIIDSNTRAIARIFTDIAAVGDKFIYGKGLLK